MKSFASLCLKATAFLSGPRPLFVVLPLLMVLLIVGTIAQKYMGIYEAQKLYFSSVIAWVGPVPLFGGIPLLGFFFINLLGKFLGHSSWTWARAGINIAHFGVIVLVFGGLMTALTAREGFVVLNEGASKAYIEDFHDRVLMVRDENQNVITQVPQNDLWAGLKIENTQLPFVVTIDTYCANCGITRRDEKAQENWTTPGKFMQLHEKELELQDEKNMTGVEFSVSQKGQKDAKYLTFDAFPKPPQIKADGHIYTITMERVRRPLPFTLTLNKFQQDVHSGTEMASAFTSDITLNDKGVTWPARIAMNEPLRHKGITLYQSSFDMTGSVPVSVLSAVENKGRIFPYLASALVAFGLIWHVTLRLRLLKRSISLALAFLFISIVPAAAELVAPAKLDMRVFAQLPVLEDGRLKPLDSFARIALKKFSGKDYTATLSADAWLATTLFDPASAVDIPVFSVSHAALRHQLGLEERKDTLYSLAELSGGLEKTAAAAQQWVDSPLKDIPDEAQNLLRLHENALEYTYILRSFSAYLPLQITLSPTWSQKAGLVVGEPVTYQTLQKISPEIESTLRALLKRKGEHVARYTREEQQLAILGMQLRTMADAGRGNVLLRVIPVGTEWVAPWTILNGGKGAPATVSVIKNWQSAAFAWQAQDAAAWNAAIQHIHDNAALDSGLMLHLEVLMNTARPFQIALALFALGFIMALGALCVQTYEGAEESARFHKPLIFTASMLIIGALLCQGFGMAARIFIMARPPVGTLYESLLFVGVVAPFLALLFQKKIGQPIAFVVAGLTGSLLGLLAYSLMGDDDTMHVLGAVLNTRFWLATHVLCITIGYGWCLITSLIAHVILLGDAVGRVSPKTRQAMLQSLQLLAIFSLLFTAVGTILGGIWADQSWGRFWGWDPKENGALLIVLWIIWVLHSKMAGQLSERQAVMAYGFLSFIVALAWIGVNLLGVGLHSYGFMEGVFWSLGLFGIFEIVVIGAAGYVGHIKRESAKNAT